MRHKKITTKFSKFSSYRKAMFYALSRSLIHHERIITTLAKGKALKRYIEPLITRAKKNTLHNNRYVFSRIRNKIIVSKLFNTLGQRFINRPGGYVRVLRYKIRKGDNAILALVEFV